MAIFTSFAMYAMAELRRRNQRVAKEIKPAARTGGQKSARLRMIVQSLTLERPVLPAVPPGPGIGQGRCPRYVYTKANGRHLI